MRKELEKLSVYKKVEEKPQEQIAIKEEEIPEF